MTFDLSLATPQNVIDTESVSKGRTELRAMSLNLLSEQLRSRLRSGVAIASMVQCVGELLDNAIDAGASCIAVRVDISKYRIQVIDNGVGVARQDLDLIGLRYATSKCHTLADLDHGLQHLGYRGEALASIIDCSGTVEIVSRHRLSRQACSKIFFHGKPTSVSPSSSQRPSVGTTVTVHDFFYNLPVRRKAMSVNIEMENIRQTMQGVALANPSVSLSLRDDQSGECVLQTRKTNSTLGSFSVLFGSGKASGMKEVSLKHRVFDITGHVSIDSHHSKALQFIYVNRRLVKKTQLHSCVNNLMTNSLVARKLSKQGDSKWQNLEKDILIPRRTSDKHAIYVLMISCSRQECDICLEPAKTLIEFRNWELVLDCLAQVVRRFLVEYNLTLGVENTVQDDSDKSPSSEQCPDLEVVSGDEGEGSLPNIVSSSCVSGSTGINVEQDGGSSCEASKKSSGPASVALRRYRQDNAVVGLVPAHKHSSALHLDRPIRSPLNYQNRSSKLAGLLRSEQMKSPSPVSMHAVRTATNNVPIISTFTSELPLVPRAPPSPVLRGAMSVSTRDPASSTLLQTHMPILQNACQISAPSYLGAHPIFGSGDVGLRCTTVNTTDWGGSKAGYDFDPPMSQDLTEGASECQLNCCDDFVPSISKTVASPSCSRVLLNSISTDRTGESCAVRADGEKELNDGPDIIGVDKVRSARPIWKETTDPLTAKKVYIHSKTGNTCSRPPEREQASHFTPLSSHGGPPTNVDLNCSTSSICEGTFSTSYGVRPISAAPHLSHDFEHYLPGCKRLRVDDGATPSTCQPLGLVDEVFVGVVGEGEEGGGGEGEILEEREDEIAWEGGSFASLLRNWTNPTFLPGQVSISSARCSDRSCIKVQNVINEYKFTREMLNSVKVLGQVDKKFIACVLDVKNTGEHDLLVLFDQHAAHERVRLEALQTDLYEVPDDSGAQPTIKSSKVCPPLLINLTANQKKLAGNFKRQFETLGVRLVQDESGSIAVASLPSVFMAREVNEVRRGRPAVALDLVQDMIIKHLEVLQATSGGSSVLPSSLTNVLNSQACHSAIKFGDPLTEEKCCDLIQSLSKCKLPFQCAHGRPSLVPVLDLSILKKRHSPEMPRPSDLCKKLSAKLKKN